MRSLTWQRAISLASIALLTPQAFSETSKRPALANHTVSVACLKDFETAYGTRYRAVRIIDDHGTGRRWLLVLQLDRPEAPALLLQMPDNHSCSKLPVAGFERRPPTSHQNLPLPVIQPGDSVILSENSPVSDARLEAIALERATAGQALTLRLKLGGHLLRAVATAPGSAVLLAERNEVRR
jgi:hypothetical protein